MGRRQAQEIALESDFHALDFDSAEYDAVHAQDWAESIRAQDAELTENELRQFEIDAEVFELRSIGWVD